MQIERNWKAGVFIGIVWTCEGYKPIKPRRQLFQSAYLRVLGGLSGDYSNTSFWVEEIVQALSGSL